MSEEIILPKGYTKLEYFASTGTQYIDLPVNTVEGDVVELVTVQRFIELSRQAEAKNGDPYFFFGINDNGNWYSGCGSGSSGMTISEAADTDWHTFRLKYTPNSSDGGFWVDDVKYRDCDGTANVLPTYISVFKTYEGNYWTNCYKKSWKLYVNDELKYELIPCLDNNGIPCMYDLVGVGTYYNQGTGDFIFHKNDELYSLPTGYTKCLYLQSDGTQYIDTEIIPNDATGLYIKAQRLNYGDYAPFGCRGATYGIYPPRANTKGKTIEYRWNSYKSAFSYDKGDDLIYSSSINLYNDRTVHFNSEDTDWDGYITETLSTIEQPLWLFSFNANGSFTSVWGGRIYRAKITQGMELIRDFVPCLDASGVPCMYDLVNGGSYYNQGSGSNFEYCIDHKLPSDFAKLKYLEATGTQYINTNYIPQTTDNGDGTYTATTGLYIDTYNITVSDSLPMGCWTASNTNTRFYAHRLHSASYNPCYGWGTYTTVSTTKEKVAYQSKLNFLNDKKAVIEAPIFSTITNTLGNLSFQPTLPIYMFGLNVGNTLKYNWKGRIYRAKISEGTEIVRDYVPAYDSRLARPCMYDIVNNVAYYNDGTGEFLYDRQYEGDYVGFTQIGGIGNRVGGHYDELPLGYVRVYFLESTGTQSIKLTDTVDRDTGLMATYQTGEGKCWAATGYLCTEKYNAISLPYRGDWSESTQNNWFWRWYTYTFTDLPVPGVDYRPNNYTKPLTGAVNWMVSKGAEIQFEGASTFKAKTWYDSFVDTHIGLTLCTSFYKTYSVKVSQGQGVTRDLIPCIDEAGRPCMYDLITKTPFNNYNTIGGDFIVGLTESQARDLYKLPPTTSGTLTISLPASIVDTDGITITDARVKSAKEKAEEKGWTFTIQTYTE